MYNREPKTARKKHPRPATITMPHRTQPVSQPRSMGLYRPDPVTLDDVQMLLSGASDSLAISQQSPCMFAVIQDKALLGALSREAHIYANKEIRGHLPHRYTQIHSDIFYNAGTLIVVYGECIDNAVMPDCWLVAENIMIQACRMGLGTCLAGLATAVLNSSAWKSRLGIPKTARAIAPIVLGRLEPDMMKTAAPSYR